jgi:hypothetical protein
MSQKTVILEHFKAGKSLTPREAIRLCGSLRLAAAVVHELIKEGWPIVGELLSAKNGNTYKEYRLDDTKEHPRDPGLFDDRTGPDTECGGKKSDTVDTSETALRPGAPPEVYGTETRSHHVANPDDTEQIYRTFRKFCEKSNGRRVTIDPGLAREVLRLNWANNRPISNAVVERYAAEMSAGEWRYNGEQISFDEKRRLLQGQHRLTACVRAAVAIVTDVAFDIDSESYATIDRGRPKSGADIARYEGVEDNHSAFAAAVKVVYRFDAGIEANRKLKTEQERDAFRRYPDIGPWVKLAVSMRFGAVKGLKGPTGVLAALLYLCARVDAAGAREFARELNVGIGGALHARHPSLIARRLINERDANFLGGTGHAEFRRILSKAWEYRRKGIEVSHFKPSQNDPDWPVGSRRPPNPDKGDGVPGLGPINPPSPVAGHAETAE